MRPTPIKRWAHRIAAAALFFTPRGAYAQVPRCEGGNPRQGEAVTERGWQHFNNATSHTSRVDSRELQRALADADESCVLGHWGALVLRAYVLHAEGRNVEAARSLDGFEASVPEARRSARERLDSSALAPALVPTIARITVHSEVDEAHVTLDAAELALDVSTAHAPGTASVRVVAAGYESASRTLTLRAGTSRSLRVTGREGASGDDVIVLQRPRPSPTPIAVVVSPRERALRPWMFAGVATTGVALVSAVAFTVWREERASPYVGLGCGPAKASAECVARYGDFSTADTLRTVGWVATGVFAATTLALWWLDRRESRSPHAMRSGCLAAPAGVSCAW